MKFEYVVDVNAIQLDDNNSSWIQAMTVGKYNHPMYGKIEFNDANLAEYAANVNHNIRGIQLDIDYDHKLLTTEAAGWVSAAKTAPNGLMLKVDWTADAASKIKEKKFKYFSPEFTTEWTHPKTGVTHKHVLFGGALTNRPFLKDIAPINLSDIPGGYMDPKLIKQLLGLSEDTSDEDAVTKLREVVELANKKPEGKTDDKNLNEPDNEALTKLAESNPAIKLLIEQNAKLTEISAATEKRLAEVEVANRMSELTLKLTEVQAKLKNIALSDETLGKLRRLALEIPARFQDQLVSTFAECLAGVAYLGEIGSKAPSDGGQDGTKKFMDAVDAYVKETKVPFDQALIHVSLTEPDLCKAYYEEMEAGV